MGATATSVSTPRWTRVPLPRARRRARVVERASGTKRDDDALALPISYHSDPSLPRGGSTFGESKCDTSDTSEDTCSIESSTEVYDTRCRRCGGNRLVITTVRKGGKYVEKTSTCMACAGTGVVRVATTRVPANFDGEDSEAAYYKHIEREHGEDIHKKRDHFREDIFANFEKQSRKKATEKGDGGAPSR